jgi:F420-non-reducing hydrogenase iron-sulfur subunit
MTATKRKTGDGRRKTSSAGQRSTGAAAKRPTAQAKKASGRTAAGKAKKAPEDKAAVDTKPAADIPVEVEARRTAQATTLPPKDRPVVSTTKTGVAPSWQPRIVVFACNWCSYAGADTAGVSRIQHQPNFRMIRVMCSGRIQPAFVLRAFEKGADGVLVSGCHFGDCHYIFGNERAVEQFAKTMNMVKLLGIEEGRLRLEWISAAEGVRFAQVINEFTDQVRDLGPSPFSKKKPAVQAEEVA